MFVKPLVQAESIATMRLAVAQNATLGECLLWDAKSAAWWWTDIQAASLHTWKPDSSRIVNYKLPDRAGSFAHCRSGRLLLGLAKRLCFANVPDNTAAGVTSLTQVQLSVQPLVAVDPAESRTRINDGRTDRRGFFVFGTINEAPEKRPIGSFYQYSVQYGLRRLALPAVAIANSICFSTDGNTMYFTDTVTRSIQQCDYHAETAKVSNIRVFTHMENPEAYPDGSVIDKNGCLWNAQWGAGSVVQYAPDGTQMQRIYVPVKNPTCPAFGGADGRQLMVSSARQEMSAAELARTPEAGSLFGLQLDEAIGLADSLFDDRDVAINDKNISKIKKRQ